ncbi:MAG TPA: carboxypeptidase-like regulatory domain-containing protein [Bryobacteraceae bacterium]|nr:carboxypeptidase-like regulatory domain-containing protein [Bryobacteraceae bacterium]
MKMEDKGRFIRFLPLLALLIFTEPPGFAQTPAEPQMPSVQGPNSGSLSTRSILGKVVDRQGNTVPGAIVLLKDLKSLQVRSFIALNDGTYHFYGLSTDIPYEVRAQANGMTSATKNISVFDSHKRITVNLKLKEPKKKNNS